MINDDNSIYYLLKDMISKGLASCCSAWIEEAVHQKNPRLSIGIASSLVLIYDQIDKKLLALDKHN